MGRGKHEVLTAASEGCVCHLCPSATQGLAISRGGQLHLSQQCVKHRAVVSVLEWALRLFSKQWRGVRSLWRKKMWGKRMHSADTVAGSHSKGLCPAASIQWLVRLIKIRCNTRTVHNLAYRPRVHWLLLLRSESLHRHLM